MIEELVGGKRTLGSAAIADASEGELYAGIGYGRPVDVATLVLRHVNAPARTKLAVFEILQLVAVAGEARPIVGAHIGRDFGHLRRLG